jgi:uncharacterized membrane protein YdbT with pleckstrin-like domain
MNQPQKYQKLGSLTFWIFVFENGGPALLAFVLFVIALFLKLTGASSFLSSTSPDLAASLDVFLFWGILISFGFLIFAILLALCLGTIDYFTYSFVLDENALRIKRGILNVEETSIPYRQIQDVDIERPVLYQMLGASRLVILTAGQSDKSDDDFQDESEGTLPAIRKDLAESLREELLKRANVEKVVEEKPEDK